MGTVGDKILVPKPPKNYARCTSTNVVNAPREPYVVKQDNGSFVDKIIFNFNRALDSPHLHTLSPNQFHCFHCKDVLRDGEACKRCTCAKCESGLGKGLCYICGHNQNSLNDSPSISETSSQSPRNINHCCYECVPVISNPEPCNNQTIDELPQTLPIFHPTFHFEAESPFTLDSTPTYVDESPNVFNPPPQPPVILVNFAGTMLIMVTIVHLKLCLSIPSRVTIKTLISRKIFKLFHNNILVVMIAGLLMTLTNQYTVNHPIFNAHNSYLDSQIQLNSTLAKIKDQMTSIISLCEMACQVVQKKLEEKQIEEERAAKAKYWKLPEPDNSLSMGDEHLDTILTTESDEFIKSGVETLIPIPSESEGIPEHVCDVPSHDNSPPLDVSKDQIEDLSESNKEFSSINDDSFSIDDIDYVEALPPDSELVSLEVMEIFIPE
nr:hypothetical protein [Tanacetum cinerariifolium]